MKKLLALGLLALSIPAYGVDEEFVSQVRTEFSRMAGDHTTQLRKDLAGLDKEWDEEYGIYSGDFEFSKASFALIFHQDDYIAPSSCELVSEKPAIQACKSECIEIYLVSVPWPHGFNHGTATDFAHLVIEVTREKSWKENLDHNHEPEYDLTTKFYYSYKGLRSIEIH